MSYAKLEQRFTQLHHFAHLGAICGWDRATMMPDGGNPARSAALAELSVLMHQRLTGPEMADWFAAAAEESLSASHQISLGDTITLDFLSETQTAGSAAPSVQPPPAAPQPPPPAPQPPTRTPSIRPWLESLIRK